MTHNSSDKETVVKTSEILDEAAAWIEEHGHVKGAYFRQPREVNHKQFCPNEGELWHEFIERVRERGCRSCALGAIELAAGGRQREVGKASGYLAGVLEVPSVLAIPEWNDRKRTTQDEVVAAIKQAAQVAREEQQ